MKLAIKSSVFITIICLQIVLADELAIGWSGTLKASIPDATASIQARVVAPLKCDPLKVNNMFWFSLPSTTSLFLG